MAKNAPWRCSCNAQFQSFSAALQHIADTHHKRPDSVHGIYRKVATVTAEDAREMMKDPLAPSSDAPWSKD